MDQWTRVNHNPHEGNAQTKLTMCADWSEHICFHMVYHIYSAIKRREGVG